MKKFFVVLLCVLGAVFGTFAYADDYGVEFPRIIFENKAEVMKVKAGEELNLTLKVRNVGDKSARDIEIKSTSKDAPVYWETAIDTYNISRMSAGSNREINIKLVVKETADVGVYGLPFSINFIDASGSKYTMEQSIYFEVTEELSKPLILIKDVTNTPAVVTADSENKLKFKLNNAGDLLARRVKLTLSGLNKDGFMVKDAIDTRYFEVIDGGKSETVSFDLLVSDKIPKGTNTLDIELSYKDQDNKDYTDKKTIFINNVQGTEGDTGKGTPKIIISKYDATPSTVTAGGKVQFDFTFKNTHLTKMISNMKVVITPDASFVIENGSNSFYIGKLAPEEELSRTFFFRAKQDSLSGTYPISIAFDYEDSDGTSHTTTEVVNLPVVEKSKLSIDNVNGPFELYVGNSGYISFEYYNKGKATISNLNVSAEGDYTAKQETNYIGNVEAGKGSYFEVELVANTPGDAKGTLIFTFEDSIGNVITERKDFSGFVYDSMPIPDEPSMPMEGDDLVEEKTGMDWWKLVLIGLGCFVITLFITRAIVIKVKMKKIEEEI